MMQLSHTEGHVLRYLDTLKAMTGTEGEDMSFFVCLKLAMHEASLLISIFPQPATLSSCFLVFDHR